MRVRELLRRNSGTGAVSSESLENSYGNLARNKWQHTLFTKFYKVYVLSQIMDYGNRKIAGSLLFVGGVQCILGIIVAEALYPGYSTSQNYISDLGVGPSALIFNLSLFILGVFGIVGAYFVQREFKSKPFSALLAIAGIGAVGVGLFTEDAGIIHAFFSMIVFTFAGMSAILSCKFEKKPLSYFAIVMGAATLITLVLFASGIYLGLGKGGMERMIAYPALLWLIGFGAHLIGDSQDLSTTGKSSLS